MYDVADLDLLGLNQTLGLILTIVTIGSIVLTVLGILYGIRTWMAQTAAFKTQRDVAEIKQMLASQRTQHVSPPAKDDEIKAGPKIAQS